MRKKSVIIGMCAMFFLAGIFLGRISLTAMNHEADVERVPWESKELDPVTSGLENVEECYLCGKHNRSLMPYFRKFDDLGIICLNTWYVLDMQIRNHDEEGNLIGPQGGTTWGHTGTGEDSCLFIRSGNSDRGISEVSVDIKEKSYFDVDNVKDHLCQECLDKILKALETYGPEGEPVKPYDLCLVDFQTLEIYSLQDRYISHSVRDYYVYIEHEDEKINVTAIYAPVLENGEKSGV